jgi:hypothetical protein
VSVKGHAHVGPPETRAGRRRVALPSPAWDELGEHVAADASGWVFPAPGGGLLRPQTWRSPTGSAAITAARGGPNIVPLRSSS